MTLRFPLLLVAGILFSLFAGSAPVFSQDKASPTQQTEIVRRYGLDPAVPLESRVQKTPEAVLKLFKELKGPAPTHHTLTEEERRQLSEAFQALPPLHQRVLRERLRSVSFLDGMPNTALTSTVNPDEPYRLFDITIRAGILRQNVSEWLTEKERTVFDAKGSPLSVSIEAGKRDALLFVLLHEATHIVDFCMGLTPPSDEQPAVSTPPTTFTEGVWSDRVTPASPYRDPLRERIRFYIGGKPLPIAQADAVYNSLRRTPFVSLYGGTNWHDDLAEYATVYHWTAVLKEPFRIVLRKDDKEIAVYEPMKSDLVRSRVGQMKRFYEKDDRKT